MNLKRIARESQSDLRMGSLSGNGAAKMQVAPAAQPKRSDRSIRILIYGSGYWVENFYLPGLRRYARRCQALGHPFKPDIVIVGVDEHVSELPGDVFEYVHLGDTARLSELGAFDIAFFGIPHPKQLPQVLSGHELGLLSDGKTSVVLQKPIAADVADLETFLPHLGQLSEIPIWVGDHYVPRLARSLPARASELLTDINLVDIVLHESRILGPGDVVAHRSQQGVFNWLGAHAFALLYWLFGSDARFEVRTSRTLPQYKGAAELLGGLIPTEAEVALEVFTNTHQFVTRIHIGKGMPRDEKALRVYRKAEDIPVVDVDLSGTPADREFDAEVLIESFVDVRATPCALPFGPSSQIVRLIEECYRKSGLRR